MTEDPLFTKRFREILDGSGVRPVRLPRRSPNLNAYAERFVRSINSECLAQVIPIGEAHLRRAVHEYVEHYHGERNHQGIGNRLILSSMDESRTVGAIECRERLGGLLRYYGEPRRARLCFGTIRALDFGTNLVRRSFGTIDRAIRRIRSTESLAKEGILMLERAQSPVITKISSRPVAETVDRLKRFIADRGFTLFRVIDHSGTAEGVGVQMPDSKLVMFGNPAKGATVMLAAPLAALDLPLKVLVWEDGNGVVSMSYNSPGFMAERLRIDGALRAPFDAIESIVETVLGP